MPSKPNILSMLSIFGLLGISSKQKIFNVSSLLWIQSIPIILFSILNIFNMLNKILKINLL